MTKDVLFVAMFLLDEMFCKSSLRENVPLSKSSKPKKVLISVGGNLIV